jgi:hypothetical protein
MDVSSTLSVWCGYMSLLCLASVAVWWLVLCVVFVSLLAECPQCYCWGIRQMLTSLPMFIDRKFITGLIIRYVSLNVTGKIILKPNIFTGTRTQDKFWVCKLCSCNFLAETNSFCLGAIVLSCSVSRLQKHSPRRGIQESVSWLWPLFL